MGPLEEELMTTFGKIHNFDIRRVKIESTRNPGTIDKKTGNFTTSPLFWDVANVFVGPGIEADVLHIVDACYGAEAANPFVELLAANSGTKSTASEMNPCFMKALVKELHSSSTQFYDRKPK